MSFGSIVGRAILALVDAMAAGVVAGVLAYLFVPVVFVPTNAELAITVAAATSAVVLAVAMALASLGKRPFPATRALEGAAERLRW